MRETMKRLFSFLLVLCMVLTMLPASVIAAQLSQIKLPTNHNKNMTITQSASTQNETDLFVFAGQSNMMGAAVLQPQVNAFTDQSLEYKYMPRLRGEETGSFVPVQNSAG
ncbi:MAG: hypothetical protein J6Q92_03580, partial [Oscillospiraceae bacterium]|nr:hypothetical protein [Oscillospiraceae bacterium]